MAKARPSVQKRIKEAKAHERRMAKAAKKLARLAAKGDRPDVEDGVDPDLVGLTAGPQAMSWEERQEAQRDQEEGQDF